MVNTFLKLRLMKKLVVILVFVSIGLIALSCRNKAEVATPATATSTSSSQQKPQPDSLILSYERTPCFGRCPVFAIMVYKSGYTTYEGKMNTEYSGMNYQYMDLEIIKGIINRANEVGFFTLRDEYDGGVSDLPYRKTFVRYKSSSKKVVNKGGGDIPEGLSEIEGLIERTFKEVSWKPVPTKNN